MNIKTLRMIIFSGFILLSCCGLLFAQQDNSSSQDLSEWYPPSAGPITAWTAPVSEKNQLLAQTFFYYTHTRGTFDAEGNSDSLPEGDRKYQYQQQLFLQYGLTDRLEISGQMAYLENFIEQSGEEAHAEGFGDTYLYSRYCFLDETKIFPQVTGIFQLKLPSGPYQKLEAEKLETDSFGTGSYEHGYGFVLTKRFKPFIFHADAIYSFPLVTKVDEVKTQYGNSLAYDIGVEYFLPKGFNLLFELNGYTQGDTKQDGDKIPANDSSYVLAVPGIGWSNDSIQTLLAYQRTIFGENTDANDSIVMTIIYNF
ncbi:MAG: transporter [Candidatus Omnitrophota bacterium]